MKAVPPLSDKARALCLVGVAAICFGALLLGVVLSLADLLSKAAPRNIESVSAGCCWFGGLGLCIASVLLVCKLRRNRNHESASR